MRIILLKYWFFVLLPFVMHGMDFSTTNQMTLPTKRRAKTEPDIILPPLELHSPKKLDSTSLSPRSKNEDFERRNKFVSRKEGSPSPSSDKDSHSRSRSRNRTTPLSTSTQSKKTIPTNEALFKAIKSVIEKQDIKTLKLLLSNPDHDPNCHNQHGLSVLHVALSRPVPDPSIIDVILENPRFESLRTNKHNLAAYKYPISNGNIREQIDLRVRLDYIVHALLTTNILFFRDNSITIQKKIEKIQSLLSRLSILIIPRYTTVEFILAMIKARLKNDRSFDENYKYFLKDPRHRDQYGNSYLHLFCYLRDKKNIKKLIQNPQIMPTRNRDDYFPQGIFLTFEEMMKKERANLFMRHSLDCWTLIAINSNTIELRTLDIFTIDSNNKYIKNIISNIKNQCNEIKTKQNVNSSDQSGQLPSKAANLPSYATDDFICELIKNHIIYSTNEKLKSCIGSSEILENELISNPVTDISKINTNVLNAIIKDIKDRYKNMWRLETSSTTIDQKFISDKHIIHVMVNCHNTRNQHPQLPITNEEKQDSTTENLHTI